MLPPSSMVSLRMFLWRITLVNGTSLSVPFLARWPITLRVVLFFYPMYAHQRHLSSSSRIWRQPGTSLLSALPKSWLSMMPWPNLRCLIRRFSVRLSFSWCHSASHSRHSGVSTDSQHSHFAWANQPRKEGGLGPDLKLPLIADRNMSISRDYGVLLEDEGIALRGLFYHRPQGGILRYVATTLIYSMYHIHWRLIARQITVNDLPVGRSVDETIRLIKAFQFTCVIRVFFITLSSEVFFQDKHGEVCPANWHEGDKTMKADPKGSKEYFSAVGDDAPNKRARQA